MTACVSDVGHWGWSICRCSQTPQASICLWEITPEYPTLHHHQSQALIPLGAACFSLWELQERRCLSVLFETFYAGLKYTQAALGNQLGLSGLCPYQNTSLHSAHQLTSFLHKLTIRATWKLCFPGCFSSFLFCFLLPSSQGRTSQENKPSSCWALNRKHQCFPSPTCPKTSCYAFALCCLPAQHQQHLQPEKHPALMAWHQLCRIAACRCYKGSFCMCRMKQKRSATLWRLMLTHLCKIPKPDWKQRKKKKAFKRESCGKVYVQKHCPHMAEPKLIAILQAVGKVKSHSNYSPRQCLYSTATCPPQIDRSSTAPLKHKAIHNPCQWLWWEVPTLSVLYVSWMQCQMPL